MSFLEAEENWEQQSYGHENESQGSSFERRLVFLNKTFVRLKVDFPQHIRDMLQNSIPLLSEFSENISDNYINLDNREKEEIDLDLICDLEEEVSNEMEGALQSQLDNLSLVHNNVGASKQKFIQPQNVTGM